MQQPLVSDAWTHGTRHMALTRFSWHGQLLKLLPEAAHAFCCGAIYFMSGLVYDDFFIVYHLRPLELRMACRKSFKIQTSDCDCMRLVAL